MSKSLAASSKPGDWRITEPLAIDHNSTLAFVALDILGMMTTFHIVGPRPVRTHKGRAARTITDEDVHLFWHANQDVAYRRGCYVFGMRTARSLVPVYVGKATRGFYRETFADNKVKRYQRVLADYRCGEPMLFFVLAPLRRGAPNIRHIHDLERFLIQNAARVNPNIANLQGTKTEQWRIHGVVRSGKGKPSSAARTFRSLLKLMR